MIQKAIFNQLSASQIHPIVVNWTRRVIANGGAIPSRQSIVALNNFWEQLVASQLDTKMKSVMCFVPDNLIAAITPLYQISGGRDPWLNTNFVAGDLTKDGLVGNKSNKYLKTGLTTSSAYSSANSCGLSLYNTTTGSGTNQIDFGCSTGPNHMYMAVNYPTLGLVFDCLTNTTPRLQIANTGWTGFLCGNKTSATNCRVDEANSSTNYFTKASQTNAAGAANSDELFMFCINPVQTVSDKRFSFAALHDGLSFADGQAFYNAVQTMRQQLGGGWI